MSWTNAILKDHLHAGINHDNRETVVLRKQALSYTCTWLHSIFKANNLDSYKQADVLSNHEIHVDTLLGITNFKLLKLLVCCTGIRPGEFRATAHNHIMWSY